MNRQRVISRISPAFVPILALLALASAGWSSGNAEAAAAAPSTLSRAIEAFGWGFGTSLTPCVYPMIAITVSVFGARQAKSKGEAALLSTAFVLGMAVLFTILFTVAGLTGGMFGAFLQSKGVQIAFGVLFLVLAASMFGAFELQLPDSVMQRLSSVGGVGFGGAFTLGIVTGPIAAPCSGPGLIRLLADVTNSQDWKLGLLYGMSYSLGLGILFWIVGTFATSLPKSGAWMVWVKSIFGIALVVLALRHFAVAFPGLVEFVKNEMTFKLIAAGVAVVGLVLGAVHLDWSDGGLAKVRKGGGILAAVGGGFLLIAAIEKPAEVSAEELEKIRAEAEAEAKKSGDGATAEPVRLLEWLKTEKDTVEKAKAEKRPMILDFGASWCIACKELEKYTFSDKDVLVKGGRFVAGKIDLTDDEDPANAELKKKYKITGLPAVIIFDSEGKEVSRVEKFVEAKEFLAILEPVK
jgi:thiol:disulfide interchange protein DsbD